MPENLNTLRCLQSGWLAIGTRDFQKLPKYFSLANMMAQMCTFNIGHSVGHIVVVIVTTVIEAMHLHQDTASPSGSQFVTVSS